MSIGVVVNGVLHILPGVYPIVDSSDLVVSQEGAQGILAIIGLGTGIFAPKTVQRVTPNFGILSRQYVAGSEILQAAKFAINPSGQVPGASQLYLMTVNAATQSVKTLVDTTGSPVNVITLTSIAYGVAFNGIAVAVDNTNREVTITFGSGAETVTEIHTYDTGSGALAALVAKINDESGLVTAALLAAGNETLATISATAFASGADGAATDQDYLDCLNQLAATNVNIVMVASSDLQVQIALADHCETLKRIGFCGMDLQTGWQNTGTRATNITAIKNRAAAIGSPAVLNSGIGTDGFASYLSVAKYAGIAAGVSPSVPLNNKDLQTIEVEADLGIEEVEDLLSNGVSPPFRRRNPNRPGFVIADGLSTYTADDNLYNRILSVRRAADGMNLDIVYELEGYLGNEATEVTVGRVINAVDRRLRKATLPSSSLRIAAYDRNAISATFEATVLKVFYSFEPVQPIRFIVPIASLKATLIEQTIEIPLGQ